MTAEHTSWLGTIHYRDADGVDVSARAAAWAGDARAFDDTVTTHLEAQGAAFLWSEEVHEAINWFTRFGHNPQMAGLARRVDAKTPAALSDPKAAGATNDDDDSYLIIEEIEDVTPLDMQIGAYPKLTVPTALQAALFGQPEPTEAEIEQYGEDVPEMSTYAILDAAKMPYLLTTELEGSGLEYQSLFQGEAQEELGEHAPYIVRLEDGNDFTRKLFTDLDPPLGLWKQELGIFVRSRADLATLRKHFRKFTRVNDQSGGDLFFRFWDSQAFVSYLKEYDHFGQTLVCSVHVPFHSFVTTTSSGMAFIIRPNYTFDGNVQLSAERVREISFKLTQERKVEELKAYFLKLTPQRFRTLGKGSADAFVSHLLRRARDLEITTYAEIAYFGCLMQTHGSWFDRDPSYHTIHKFITTDEFRDNPHRIDRMHQVNLEYNETVLGTNSEHALDSFKRSYKRAETLNGQFRTLNRAKVWDAIINDTPNKYAYLGKDVIARLLDTSRHHAAEFGCREEWHFAIFELLSYALGIGFYDDVFYPWVKQILNDRNQSIDKRMERLMNYAQKRLRKTLVEADNGVL